MTRRIILNDRRPGLVSTLDAILRHWGYTVLTVHRLEDLIELASETEPDLVMIGTSDYASGLAVAERIDLVAREAGATIILLQDGSSGPDPCDRRLSVPFDLFELFGIIQQYLEKIPRRNLRIDLALPGLIGLGRESQLVEILSLSSHGLFVKTACRAEPGSLVHLVLPLIGLRRELDLICKVLYVISPTPENNYLQGFGVEFVDPNPQLLDTIRIYLEQRLLDEVQGRSPYADLEETQINRRTPPSR